MSRSRFLRRSFGTLSAAIVLLVHSGCAAPQTRSRITRFAAQNAGFTPAQQAFVQRNVGEFGMPKKTGNFGRTDFVARWGYVLEHSAHDKIALWVEEKLEKAQIDGSVTGGRPKWQSEPLLPVGMRAEDTDYKPYTDEFDRGHMCPNADFDTKTRRDETFFLSNVVPQNKNMNEHMWAELEAKVRGWVKHRGQAYVITGGFLYDPVDDPDSPQYNPQKADGSVDYSVIGKNEVVVPTHIFKIVLAPKSPGSNQWEAIAFVFENKAYKPNVKYEDGLRSIRWIEKHTDLNFFPDMEPAKAQAIEGVTPTQLWPDN